MQALAEVRWRVGGDVVLLVLSEGDGIIAADA